MIRFRKQNAQHPEQETQVEIDLLPLLTFGIGFLAVRMVVDLLQELQRERQP